jgi:hypothetical protein
LHVLTNAMRDRLLGAPCKSECHPAGLDNTLTSAR